MASGRMDTIHPGFAGADAAVDGSRFAGSVGRAPKDACVHPSTSLCIPAPPVSFFPTGKRVDSDQVRLPSPGVVPGLGNSRWQRVGVPGGWYARPSVSGLSAGAARTVRRVDVEDRRLLRVPLFYRRSCSVVSSIVADIVIYDLLVRCERSFL